MAWSIRNHTKALDGVRYVCVCVCVCVLTFDSSTMLIAELFLGLINSKICNYKYLIVQWLMSKSIENNYKELLGRW